MFSIAGCRGGTKEHLSCCCRGLWPRFQVVYWLMGGAFSPPKKRAHFLTVELALLLARVLLAAVFLLAGVAKLADPKGTTKAFRDFGLQRALAALLALSLPFAEIAVAIALIPLALAWYGASAALALLSVFMIAVAVAMIRGRKPECHCFGQLHSAPVGTSTLIRNGVLIALAAWLVLRGQSGVGPSLWGHLAAAADNEQRLFAVAGVVMAFLIWRASRRPEPEGAVSVSSFWDEDEDGAETASTETRTPVRVRASAPDPEVRQLDPELQKILEGGIGWPIGTRAPQFELPDVTGQRRSLEALLATGKPVCLLFSSPHCEPCKALWPHIGRWAKEHDQILNIIVITRGTAAENHAKQNNLDAWRVLLQPGLDLSDAYGVSMTPAAVLIGADGLIQSQLAIGRADIQKLITAAVSNHESPRATSSS